MRLNVGAENLLERIGLLSEMVPTPLVEVSLGAGYARCIVAGTRLGLFEALHGRSLSAEELAEAASCSLAGTRALANALSGFGYLKRRGGQYSLTTPSKRWLLKGAKRSLYDAVCFLGECWDMLANLEEGVRTGHIVRLHERQLSARFWEHYMRGLASFAKIASGEIVRRLKVPRGATRVLDVGGGHGLYGGALCQKHGGLRSEVFDLAGAADVGQRIVAEEGLSDRVSFRTGDFRTDDWGSDYDLVLLFNVLHNATAEEGRAAVAAALAALRPGGTLAILDASHRDDGGRIDATTGYNELFFFLVSGAQAWPEATMRGWMDDAGFGPSKATTLLLVPTVLITAQRPT